MANSQLDVVERALGLIEIDPEGARRDLERASAGFGAVGDGAGRGECLLALARLAMGRADLDEAQRFAERAAECFPDADRRLGLAHLWAGRIATVRDDELGARRHLDEAIKRLTGGDLAQALELRGQLDFDLGELEDAERWYLRAWRVVGELNHPLAVAGLRERFAELAWARGRPAEVAAQLEGAIHSLAGISGANVCLRRARLRTDLADHYADLGRVDTAVDLYETVRAELLDEGLVDRALRLERRIAALRHVVNSAVG